MIVVFGSINMDMIMRVKDFPREGETILSPSYEMSPGGKGANQAMACARGDAKTALIGKVGDDGMGHRILTNLRRNEVMTSGVATSDFMPTGMAVVTLNSRGENQIIVASGANMDVSNEQVPDEILKTGNIVLFQMEVAPAESQKVMMRAKKHGATTILNVAPAAAVPQQVLDLLDYLIVNEHEARTLAEGLSLPAGQDLVAIAKALAVQGKLHCIVTLGEHGSICMAPNGTGLRVPALKLDEVVDTTGAGDCFCGTFAAALHNKSDLPTALRRASIASGLSCKEKGAQDSYPYIGEVDELLAKFPPAQAI